MGNPEALAPPARRGRDVDEAARVVRSNHLASRATDRVELPTGEPIGDPRPFQAEGAAEAAAVRDVGKVHHLVARELEQAAGLALETELAQALARIVVGDLQAHPARVDQSGIRLEQLEREAGGVAEAGLEPVILARAPLRGVDGEGAEA